MKIRNLNFISLVIVFFNLNFSTSSSAASFDCSKPNRAQEKFICQYEEISRLDEEMAKAYQTQMKILSGEAQSAVQTSQRSWLAYWPRVCSDSATTLRLVEGSKKCVADLYRARISELSVSSKAGRSSFMISEFRYIPPSMGNENPAIHKISFPQVMIESSKDIALNIWMSRDINNWKSQLKNSSDSEIVVNIDFMTPKIVKITETGTFYGHGSAHPISGIANNYFVRELDRTMQANDFFTGNRWMNIISKHVYLQLQKRLGNNLQIRTEQDLLAIIGQTRSWLIKNDTFKLQFNPYEVAPYSEGFIDVEVPLALLKQHMTFFALEWMKNK